MNKKFKKILLTVFLPLLLATLVFALINSRILKAGNDECFVCHEDKDLTMDKNGKKVSVYVNPADFKKSVHGGSAECKDCHEGYNPDALPHNPNKKEVNCRNCHESLKGISESVHKSVKCADCHGEHNIKPAKEFAKEQTGNCLSCHKKKSVQEYKMSAHSKKDVKCESCHEGGHNSKKISKNEVQNTCGKCHGQHQKDFNNSIHQTVMKSGNTKAPTCTDCHGAHKILTNKMTIESEGCLKCHLDEKMFPGEDKGSAKFVSNYKTSVHASIQKSGVEAAGCIDCHGDHMIQQEKDPKASTNRAKLFETCGKCHKDVVDHYKKSQHGIEMMKNNPKAPSCADCHGEHDIKSVITSSEFSKINQVELCLKCHQEQKLPHKNYKGEEGLVSHYKESYHYKALQEGKTGAATCSDCHGSHEMKKYEDPASTINKKNIPQTCGQSNCHVKQLAEYTGSVHEVAITQKNSPDAPNCTDCHGKHQIAKNDEKSNRLSQAKGIVQLCSDCHNSVELTTKYNLPVGRTDSYMNSFHGLAIRGGSKLAADCASCHGFHNIRNSKDSLSTISKKNLPETCGKCHPGASTTLFNTSIHQTNLQKDSPLVDFIRKFYLVLIFLIIGGMILHNILDFIRKSKKHKVKHEEEEKK